MIGKPPPKRQHDQCHQNPDRPFPDVLGGPAEHVQPSRRAWGLGHGLVQRKQQRFAYLDQVVCGGKGRRQDAAPLMQAGHQGVGAQARQQDELVAQGPDIEFSRWIRPDRAGPGQQGQQQDGGKYASHRFTTPGKPSNSFHGSSSRTT
ncbi:hypothetical protein G6F57_015945 [Rhizopus arrhizus]|nr:hypothetical protein G6F57_015945 [Rhizopus arrhizus]